MNIFKPNTLKELLDIMQDTICNDYCVEDNCRNCNWTRLQAIQSKLMEVPVDWLKSQYIITQAMVSDGVVHKDALAVIQRLLNELDSPITRKVRKNAD